MDDNIHAPTVSSGPTSGEAPRDLATLSLVDLMQEKERIEEELSALSSVLSSHGVNMNTSLTTFDGYPRDDIDVAQSKILALAPLYMLSSTSVRTIRSKIIRLRNDHKEAMTHLEKKVHDHFTNLHRAQIITSPPETPNEGTVAQAGLSDNSVSNARGHGLPFATVNSVVSASPADQAGLKTGDTICNFGNVNWMNHERLTKVADLVQQNEGRTLTVKVIRKDELGGSAELDLQLTPRRNWGGRGLLGCHLVPL
ncbi:putative 26S proteasome non-ATPase regulatory subunit Nas2 [Aspergillus tanneri]|nr:putative 26S proteasome regulatory subunit [Aspergillus tanneri]KAA8649717.1 putative 26S proteasome regulatory subunit [Aspergillus tanneri]